MRYQPLPNGRWRHRSYPRFKCISIEWLLADGGLDLEEGGLQLTRCQESMGLEHVAIDH